MIAGVARQLGAVAGASAPIDARRIAEAASGWEAAELAGSLDEEVPGRQLAAFDRMVVRRCDGEPLQYVVGAWGFRTLDLLVDDRAFIPRPETEVVAGVALEELERHAARAAAGGDRLRAVDLGTGTGAIALSLAAEQPAVDVWATDASDEALDVARANLAGTGRAAARVTLSAGSWYEALPDELRGTVDVVVSNPPYVRTDEQLLAEVAEWEPEVALRSGPTGLGAVEVVVAGASEWLTPDGSLVVEHAPVQAPRVVALAEAAGFAFAETRVDLTGRPRLLLARR